MSKIAILTDTSANLSEAMRAQYNIHTVPHNIQWGDEAFLDSVNITTDEFYQRLATDPVIPTTAQITMTTFLEAFEKLAKDNDEILVLLLSSEISGTLSGAVAAVAEFDKVPVEIVDSRSTTGGLALINLAAGRALAAGKSLQEAAVVAREVSDHSHLYFVVDTLKYLHRGGRIGGASRFLGTMLNVKPVLYLDGSIEAHGRIRGKKKALKHLIDIMAEKANDAPVHLAVFHAAVPDVANNVLAMAKDAIQVDQSYIFELSPVLGTHVGAGAVGIALHPARVG
ncbi:MAG: DegV family protein [Chloroflexi bacterium]|nr:DegV family protein [Chloroflexota bacterium]